jgi:hypothetical protein
MILYAFSRGITAFVPGQKALLKKGGFLDDANRLENRRKPFCELASRDWARYEAAGLGAI